MRVTRHWWDGWLYQAVIAPNTRRTNARVARLVHFGSRVLDVGCGTGELVATLAPRAREVVGIDLSRRMVEFARARPDLAGCENVEFHVGRLQDLFPAPAVEPGDSWLPFDYAVMSYVLHEMACRDRVVLLRWLARVARHLVVVDYDTRGFHGIAQLGTCLTELAAGTAHFLHFLDYRRRGGLLPLLAATRWHVVGIYPGTSARNFVVAATFEGGQDARGAS